MDGRALRKQLADLIKEPRLTLETSGIIPDSEKPPADIPGDGKHAHLAKPAVLDHAFDRKYRANFGFCE